MHGPKQPHPCDRCTLPDCDRASAACELKRAMNTYRRFLDAGIPIPEDVRQSRNIANRELYAAEANRRYRAKHHAEILAKKRARRHNAKAMNAKATT